MKFLVGVINKPLSLLYLYVRSRLKKKNTILSMPTIVFKTYRRKKMLKKYNETRVLIKETKK